MEVDACLCGWTVDLRREYILSSQGSGILSLPPIKLEVTKCVLPPETIPVRDVVSKDEHSWIFCKFEDVGISWRTRRAPLTLKQFDHGKAVRVGHRRLYSLTGRRS